MEKKRRRKVFIILLQGDLLFEKKLLERLIAENGNRVLVNKNPFFQKVLRALPKKC